MSEREEDRRIPGERGLFLSYAGPLSRTIAEELGRLVKNTLGIDFRLLPSEPGVLKIQELSQRLANSNFGVCVLTPDNRRSRWIYFEAGALLRFAQPSKGSAKQVPELESRVVPLYYPKFPVEGAQYDPLRELCGREATAEGIADLVTAIAEHFHLAAPDPAGLRAAWNAALKQIGEEQRRIESDLPVGLFATVLNDIQDHYTEVGHRENHFRKFLFACLLKSVRGATEQLTTHHDPEFQGFADFAARVRSLLPNTTDIRALCGHKPWGTRPVADYYQAQYAWAARLKSGGSSGPKVRRIFVRPAGGSFDPSISSVIRQHAAHAGNGVIAKVLDEVEARAEVPGLHKVWDSLIADGFGFIALKTGDHWEVLAHMQEPGTGLKGKFLGVTFTSAPVTAEVLKLFDNLYGNADEAPPEATGGL